MLLRFFLLLGVSITLSCCNIDGLQLRTASDWSYHSLVAWKHADPRGIAMAADEHWLYVSSDGQATALGVSLWGVNMKTGRKHILIYGMNKASALALAPDATLWLGEAFDDGLVWRITTPQALPEEQQIQRLQEHSDNPAITTLKAAGVFDHQAIAFSLDGHYAYLADGIKGGSLYRFNMHHEQLQVWHDRDHWITIDHPDEARIEAEHKEARGFAMIEGITVMDDGRLLLAESESGHILVLEDNKTPHIEEWLQNTAIQHPNSIAWDSKRGWLWIADEGKTSWVWAWDGQNLQGIAHHEKGVLAGIHVQQGRVFVNIRRKQNGLEATIELIEKHTPNHD